MYHDHGKKVGGRRKTKSRARKIHHARETSPGEKERRKAYDARDYGGMSKAAITKRRALMARGRKGGPGAKAGPVFQVGERQTGNKRKDAPEAVRGQGGRQEQIAHEKGALIEPPPTDETPALPGVG